MPEPQDQKKVSNHDLPNSQWGGGLIDAETVNAERIGGDIWNIFLGRQEAASCGQLSTQEYRNRQVLLNKVNNFWVKGVLEKSLHEQILIQLGLEERPDAIEHPWAMVWEAPQEQKQPQPLPPDTKVIDKFDELGQGRSLLILGEPGSGKTMTLLELARDLISFAQQDINHPIPVVFNLSSWVKEKQAIADWLIEELNAKYQVSQELGKTWLKGQQLLLLLDGLDEVRSQQREACIQAINQFSQEYGQTEIVVTSRLQDYQALSNRLNFQAALCLMPLTVEQAQSYLSRAGKELAAVRVALEADAALQELARSPLMLNIMTVAYQGISTEDLPTMNLVERHNHLFNAYIQRMFDRRGACGQYSLAQAQRWLVWLAQSMSRQCQTVFLIERMQPSWLSTKLQKWMYVIYTGLSFGLIIVLIAWLNTFAYEPTEGLLLGLGLGLIFGLTRGLMARMYFFLIDVPQQYNWLKYRFERWIYPIELGMNFGLGFALGFWKILPDLQTKLSVSLMIGLVTALILASVSKPLGLNSINRHHISPVETLRWSWLNARNNLVFGLISGLSTGLSIGLLQGLVEGLRWAFIWGLSGGLMGLLGGGIMGADIEARTMPNQGIWQSAKFTLVFVINAILWLVLLFQLTGIPMFSGVILGLFFVPTSRAGEACIRHFILRVVLYCTRCIPWNYARFLDYATERIFLQKVGGGYIFIHRLLLEHFARMEFGK